MYDLQASSTIESIVPARYCQLSKYNRHAFLWCAVFFPDLTKLKNTSMLLQCISCIHYQCDDPVMYFPCFKPFYLTKSTVATTHFPTSVTIQCCFDPVLLFQTILSHQKHCCYYASPPVWRSNEVLLFSLFQTILSHQKHFSPKALLLLRISPPVWRSGAVFPVLNHSISPKALLLLHFTTSVTIQCCFPCFKPFYLTKSTVATAFHYQCDDPVLFSCFKPFYLTKSTVATTHFTTSVTIQCCFPVFPVSNHSISPKALLLLHFTTSVTIQCSSAVSLFQTILSHQKHCCYYAFHHECDDPVQFCCFPCFKPFYLTKSTVATTHFTTSVTIQCSSAVSNHSILPLHSNATSGVKLVSPDHIRRRDWANCTKEGVGHYGSCE